MKNLLTATMPALALLALGGCATSGALTTSTETDGVYYSSSDHTTAVASPAQVAYGGQGTIPARALDDTTPINPATGDDANPDYQGGTTNGVAGTDYYSNSYDDGLAYYTPSGFNQPYAGPGVSTYNYSPAYAASPSYYGSPFGYNAAFGYGYSPLAFGYSPFSYGYSPFGYGYPYGGGFYDSFYSPYGYGYGSGLSIGFGYGFGGFGSPFGYSPFGYGGGYPYGYASGFGRGGYGYGGYGYGREYARSVIYTRGAGVSSPGAGAVLYGSRSNRGGAVMNPGTNANRNANAVNLGGRPSPGSYTGNATAIPGGGNMGAPAAPVGRGGRAVSFGGDATGQPTYSTPGTQTNATTPNGAPGAGGRRGFFGGFFGTPNGAPAGQSTMSAGQPANTGSYGRRERAYTNYGQNSGQTFHQSMQQRTSAQPQPTYNQPQQQSQPTYSQPSPSRSFGGGSFGGGGGGGGSFGGGGGGGGGRGRR